jgi:hypothetical protein
MHKQIGIIVLLLLALGLNTLGCGSGTGATPVSGSINGAWAATLTNADGSLAYQFTATFTQGTGTELSITNLTFANPGPCLSGDLGAAGSFAPATEAFGMSMVSPAIIGPYLNLQGTLSEGQISGTWSTSSGVQSCNGSGTFTIQPSTAG